MDDIEQMLHMEDVRIDCIEAVRKESNTAVMDVTEEAHEPIIDKIWQVKSHIGTLKCAWALSEAAAWFANGLEQESLADLEENWLSCGDEAQEKDLMNKERKEAENVKNDMEEIEEKVKKHAEEIQTTDEAIKEQRLHFENKLIIIKEKMEKLKKLEERKQFLERQKQEYALNCGSANYKEHLTEKLEQTTGALTQCKAAVDSLTEHKTLLETERDAGQNELIKLDERLSATRMGHEKFLNSPEQERMDFLSKFMTSCGVRVLKIAGNWIEIEVADIYDEGPHQHRSTLQLTVHFGEKDGHYIIEDITANSSMAFIQDLIDYLKSNQELKLFNMEVQKRFHNHVKLLKEMKSLQERFAIDWDEREQIVRLMLGKAGQIVCTLKLQNGYPTNSGVTVVEIHGAKPAIVFQDSLVTKELRTLTSWIEYLDIKYSAL